LAFEPGQIVGDYEILDSLGSGGMGHVYRVRNVISSRVEAMKALKPGMVAEPEFAARFSAEIRTLASFDHPNIAQLRTAFRFGDEQLMVMEYVEGCTLDVRAREGALDASEVIAITRQILSALSYAHSRGVIHRDIKPANVMVTTGGVVKLMDFGIAKSASENRLTEPGSTIGSFYYISPEQVRGEPVDARSDVYSVGILLYELLSGRRPFQAETTYKLLNQQLNDTPQPPIELNPKMPQALNDLVLMAMAKNPAERFQTADAFSRALTGVGESLRPSTGSTAYTTVANQMPGVSAAPKFAAGQMQAKSGAPAAIATPPQRKQHRAMWVLGGALAVVVVFVAALTLAPRFSRTAAKSYSAPQPSQAAVAASAAPAALPVPKRASAEPPVAQSTQSDLPAAAPVSVPPPVEPPPATIAKASPKAARKVSTPRQDAVAPTPAPQQDAAAAPATSQQAPATGPSEQELEQAGDQLTKLNSRASAVAGSVDRLQQQQAADGLGLRQDMAGAYSRMNSYLRAADNDLAARNLAAVQRHMDLAEKEIATLESFFNK